MLKFKINKRLIALSLPIIGFVISLILSIFLIGASSNDKYGYQGVTLSNFIFGNGEIMLDTGSLIKESGLSYFAFLSFIVGLVGADLLLYCLLCNNNNKKLIIISQGLVILSGLLILLVCLCGTNVIIDNLWYPRLYSFNELFKNFKIGIGTIMWSILCIASSSMSILLYLININEVNYEKI